jgi:hypothetical protein
MELNNFIEHARAAVGGLCPILSTINWRRRGIDGDAKGPGPLFSMLLSLMAAGVIGIVSGTIVLMVGLAQVETKLQAEIKRMDEEHARVSVLEMRFNNHVESRPGAD